MFLQRIITVLLCGMFVNLSCGTTQSIPDAQEEWIEYKNGKIRLSLKEPKKDKYQHSYRLLIFSYKKSDGIENGICAEAFSVDPKQTEIDIASLKSEFKSKTLTPMAFILFEDEYPITCAVPDVNPKIAAIDLPEPSDYLLNPFLALTTSDQPRKTIAIWPEYRMKDFTTQPKSEINKITTDVSNFGNQEPLAIIFCPASQIDRTQKLDYAIGKKHLDFVIKFDDHGYIKSAGPSKKDTENGLVEIKTIPYSRHEKSSASQTAFKGGA